MTACTPSYTTEVVPHDASPCMELCANVTFTVDSVDTGNSPNGDCTFDWSVTRSGGADPKTLTGSAKVACPGTKTIELYCDSTETCVGFKLHLTCAGDG